MGLDLANLEKQLPPSPRGDIRDRTPEAEWSDSSLPSRLSLQTDPSEGVLPHRRLAGQTPGLWVQELISWIVLG
jgi:hypothetical protein